MQITWLGQACFQITTQSSNGEAKIVIDPYKDIGLKLPRNLAADLVLKTHDHFDHAEVGAVAPVTEGKQLVVSGPGEYESGGVMVYGIHAWHDNVEGKERGAVTMYVLESEGIKVAHLGDIGQKELTEQQMEQLGRVDVLMIPVGGVYTVDAAGAMALVQQIEPRVVIPMHYAVPGLTVKLDGVEKFLKSWGGKAPEPVEKFKIAKKDLPAEDTQLVVFQNP